MLYYADNENRIKMRVKDLSRGENDLRWDGEEKGKSARRAFFSRQEEEKSKVGKFSVDRKKGE